MILSREDYESLDETAHLLRSPANARALMEAAIAAPYSEFVPVSLEKLRHAIEEH